MVNNNLIKWDLDLIKRYDLAGPRYTSYPTAVQFDPKYSPMELVNTGNQTTSSNSPLSLYIHIPFCAHVCYYCACNKVITRNREKAQPYLNILYKEIEQQAKWYSQDRQVTQLHWGGGTPTFISHEQMIELMTTIRQNFNLLDKDQGDYSIEIDPREANTDTIHILRELGFNRISLGLQDTELQVQQAVNRVQSIEHTTDILDTARSLGYRSLNLDLIYGLPHQTFNSFMDTLHTVIDMNPDRLSIFNYAHLPDRFRPQRHIQAEDLPAPETKLAILESTISTLLASGYIYIGMDHFAKPDDKLAIAQQQECLHRNFQGYTTHSECDLVAMGVSSISQVGSVYYQNEHEIEAYTKAIEKQNYAIKRGVCLTEDDHIRRRVITQLICHFHLDKRAVEAELNIDFDTYFADAEPELKYFAKDGLIEMDNDHIRVSPTGRLLIRRICMAFDAYIPKDQTNQRFSRII